MPRKLRIALTLAAALVALLVVGVVIVVSTVDPARYAALAAAEVEQATGRKLLLGGKVEVHFLPRIAITAEEVSLGNASWGSRPAMLTLKRVEAELALMELLRGRVHFERLKLIEPDLLLETDAKGTGNWVLRAPAQAPASATETRGTLAIASVEIRNGTIAWRSAAAKTPVVLSIQKLTLGAHALGAGGAVDVQGTLHDQPFTLKGSVGELGRALAQDSDWPMDLRLETAGAQASVKGKVNWGAQGPAVDAAVAAIISNDEGVRKLMDASFQLPLPFILSAQLATHSGEQRLDSLSLQAGKTTVAGKMVIRTGATRPFITATLKSAALDLGSAERRQAAQRDGRIFSSAPFPLAPWRGFDGDFDLAVERLIVPSRLVLENVTLRGTLRAARLALHPIAASIAGGALSGSITLDASRLESPTLAFDLAGKAMSMERLAAELGHPGSIKGGHVDMSVRLAGPGASPRSFAAGANGELTVVMGQARLAGTALEVGGDVLSRVLELASPAQRRESMTELRCGVIRLPIRNGVATSQRSIAYETARVNLVAAGTIDLRTEALDLALKPTIKEGMGIGAGALADGVRVTGTLASPAVGIDTLGSARAALSVAGAVLTSGLSLLGENLLTRGLADPHPCKTALGAGMAQHEPSAPKPDAGGLGSALRRIFK